MAKLFFNHIAAAPPDPILDLTLAFNAEKDPKKVNLSVGFYRNAELKTPVLKSVKKAEALLLESEKTKEYLPIVGDKTFLDKIGCLVFGDFFWLSNSKRIACMQGPGGTGCLRIGGDFLKQEVGEKIVIPDPTWPNHRGVFLRCGLKVESYPYYDFEKNKLDFDRCIQYFKGLSPGSVVLLQACCHNPTGADFSLDQWKTLSDLFRENGLLPFFDFAYQGFGFSIEGDAQAIRLFAKEGHEMAVAYSLSKNFGLYGERTGALFIVAESEQIAENVTSKMKTIARATYSNPPLHGAKVAAAILSTPALRAEWESEVEEMRSRIHMLRARFTEALAAKSRKKDFRFLAGHNGMFCYLGLDKAQVAKLVKEDKIFMTQDGRINVLGLNDGNFDYVVDAITRVANL
jgi:aspartate/tyrosine/aromatic aminotransferase